MNVPTTPRARSNSPTACPSPGKYAGLSARSDLVRFFGNRPGPTTLQRLADREALH